MMAVYKTNEQRESLSAGLGTRVSGREWKESDRSRELGMREASRGRLRNDSGFWVQSLELRMKPLKEKRT